MKNLYVLTKNDVSFYSYIIFSPLSPSTLYIEFCNYSEREVCHMVLTPFNRLDTELVK